MISPPVISLLFFIILISQFDIIVEFIVTRNFGEFKRRTETTHETVFGIAGETGDFFNDVSGEPVVNEFVVLIFDQSFLESEQSPVSFETKHIDELIQIQPDA